MPASHRRMHRRAENVDVGQHLEVKKEVEQHEKRADGAVVKTVYKTMAATFDGPIGGYKTVGKDDDSDSQATQTQASEEEAPVTTQKANNSEASKKLAAAAATTTQAKAKATTTASAEDREQTEEQSKTEAKETAKSTDEELSETTAQEASSIPTAIVNAATETESIDSILAQATGQASVTHSSTLVAESKITSTAALASATSSSDASSSGGDDGSSTGAKAGIAFGVLGGVLVVGLLVFFLFNRKKKEADRQRLDDDEKLHGPMVGGVGAAAVDSDAMSTRTNPHAPRISLRPVTQFLPNWNYDKRSSKGAAMAMSIAPAAAVGAAAASSRAPNGSAREYPVNGQSTNPANPFGSHAERIPTPIIEEQSMHATSTPPSPVSEKALAQDPMTANGPAVAAGATLGAAAAGAGAGALTRKTSMRNDGPKKLDLTLPGPFMGPIPASPSGTEFSVSSASPDATTPVSAGAAAIAAAGGPANAPVHRVQLDFKPTLDDELDLKAGELVRLLHEYDDGWALCIRLDRSQQGVVPRTCLSTRPVKPRPAQPGPGPRPGPPVKPNGPPRGPGPNYPPGQRPMTPQGQRPMTPQGPPGYGRPRSPSRPMTAGSRPASPGGRPMTPSGPRPQSPGPRAQSPGPRSQSPSGMNRRASPPGPSPMNPTQSPRPQGPPASPVGRKPVPGQAY